MRDKNAILKDLGDFYSNYQNATSSNDIDAIRDQYKKLREEVRQHCPNAKIFKPILMTRTIDDYKIPDMAQESIELLLELGKK